MKKIWLWLLSFGKKYLIAEIESNRERLKKECANNLDMLIDLIIKKINEI